MCPRALFVLWLNLLLSFFPHACFTLSGAQQVLPYNLKPSRSSWAAISNQDIQFYWDCNKPVFIPNHNSVAKNCSSELSEIHILFMMFYLLPLRYVILTCLTEITRVYQTEVTSCPSLHIKDLKVVTVYDCFYFFSLHFFFCVSLGGYPYLTEIPTFCSAVQTERFPGFWRYSRPPGGISTSTLLDWLKASLSYLSFSLSWISMAHSPCLEHRAREEMERKQVRKLLSHPVNLYEVHKQVKKEMIEKCSQYKKAEGCTKKGQRQ